MRNIDSLYWCAAALFFSIFMASCAIENDIPYPIIESSIESMVVEGQRGAESTDPADAVIDKKARTVMLYVNDSVDISNLKITRLKVTADAELFPDSAACKDYDKFPRTGFASLDSIPLSSNTRMNFSNPVNFILRTYQDYVWKVTVNQIVQRDIEVDGLVKSVVDESSRSVILYVGEDKDLTNLNVSKMNLGGEFGEVSPDPTKIKDYSSPVELNVQRSWEKEAGIWYKWTVYVYHDDSGESGSADVFPMVSRAYLKGSVQSGKTPVIEYKKQGDSGWTSVPSSDVTVSGTSFSTEISGLEGSTTYTYRVSVDGVVGNEKSFTTVAAVALENGSMEEWSQEEGKRWNPWAADANPFWGTGNKGSAIVPSVGNITAPTDESISGKAAYLESKLALIKLAAGNLFTGDFDLDGMNGLLHFGRPFTSFPTALRLYYKYISVPIDEIGDNVGDLASMKGEQDICHIYIALSDKSEPYEIRNNPDKRQLFDKDDANIIAYGEFSSNQSTSSYKQIEIPLEYRYTNRTPKYIIIVASSSKYGDYYVGGVGSKLWLDEMELVYE